MRSDTVNLILIRYLMFLVSIPSIFAASDRPKIPTGTNYGQDILKYSPFDLPAFGHRIEQLSSGSYIIMPSDDCGRLITAEKQMVFYHPGRDTWELGPTHREADCIDHGYPLGNDVFLLDIQKVKRMRGLLGMIHRFLEEPDWIAGTWDKGPHFWCFFDAKKKEYLACERYEPENVRTILCDDRCSEHGYRPKNPKIDLHIYFREGAWQFEWKTPEALPQNL
jgi:hypothetical protein